MFLYCVGYKFFVGVGSPCYGNEPNKLFIHLTFWNRIVQGKKIEVIRAIIGIESFTLDEKCLGQTLSELLTRRIHDLNYLQAFSYRKFHFPLAKIAKLNNLKRSCYSIVCKQTVHILTQTYRENLNNRTQFLINAIL